MITGIVLAILLGLPVWLVNRIVSQHKLNIYLLKAVDNHDALSTKIALQQGADANSEYGNVEVKPWWREMIDALRNKHAPKAVKTSVLLELLLNEAFDTDDASIHGDNLIVKLLLENGANPNFHDMHNHTPIGCAMASCDYESVKLLLEHGADPNSTYPTDDFTPLVSSIYSNDMKMINLLLDHGANINLVVMPIKITPLSIAIMKNNPAIVRLLIDRHADVNLANILKETPLELAESEIVMKHDPSIINLLKLAGAHK